MLNQGLERFVYLSIAAAGLTIFLKTFAYVSTGSLGLLSDALESLVNLVAAIIVLFVLRLSQKPPDDTHSYGHTKAEYFSSIIEGVLILIAAISIGVAAVDRFFTPQPLEHLSLGIFVSLIASSLNFVIGYQLLKAGKKYNSIALEADAKHLFTDVWTSIGVMVGIGVVGATGLYILDPIIALIVAVNIVYTGIKIIKQSALGFMDTAILAKDREIVINILNRYAKLGVKYHAFRSRQSGMRKFVSVHLLFPGRWSIKKGHDFSERIEREIRKEILNITISTHLEPIEDPKSQKDISIFRE